MKLKTVDTITYQHQSKEETSANTPKDRLSTAEVIATGKRTAWEIQQENSLFPLDAKIEINWTDLSELFECAYA